MKNFTSSPDRRFVVLVTTAFLLTVAVSQGFAQTPSKQRPGGTVAIDTLPMPEKPIRFERFFLDQLRAAGAIDSQVDLNARFRLNIEAIKWADTVAYPMDGVPEECLQPSPPRWCWVIASRTSLVARGVTTEGRILLVDSLLANGVLVAKSPSGWHSMARTASFVEFAPTVFQHIKADGWSAQKAMDILDRSFAAVSGVAYPAPDGYWGRYCIEHPEDRICWLIHEQFASAQTRNLARELVLVSLLQQEKLLSIEQARAIYDVTYRDLSTRRGLTDLSIVAGVVIVNGLRLNPKQRNGILNALATSRVGLIDPDSPWADICFRENPPLICRYIHAFPRGATLTTQLVKHGIWAKADAIRAWSNLYRSRGGGVIRREWLGSMPKKGR